MMNHDDVPEFFNPTPKEAQDETRQHAKDALWNFGVVCVFLLMILAVITVVALWASWLIDRV